MAADTTYNTANQRRQGGATTTIGSGGTLDIESGGVFSIAGTTVTPTAAELNTLHSQTLTTGAAAGFTGGTGTIYKNSVQLSGGIYRTQILFDLTGLGSSTTDLDIIGQGASAAYMG